MKQFFLIIVFAISAAFLIDKFRVETQAAGKLPAAPNESIGNKISDNKQPVLIELYTSEGCPVCPPADRNLTFLENEQPFVGADLITLSLHVDYWNSGGWRDEFSSSMFSRRQDIYRQVFRLGSIYTPQMIVDGQMQFIGTDLAKAQKAIIESAKIAKGEIELSTAKSSDGIKLRVKILDLPKHETATVFLAVAEDNLASATVRGENSGVKRAFTSVVRELKSLGFLNSEKKNLDVETFLQLQPNWERKNVKLVVFVQENGSRKILGVGRTNLP